MYQFGPYGPNHATAGTFAFKRELLKEHKYNDNASLAEEKAFLTNTDIFMFPENKVNTPVSLQVKLPEQWQEIATGLKELENEQIHALILRGDSVAQQEPKPQKIEIQKKVFFTDVQAFQSRLCTSGSRNRPSPTSHPMHWNAKWRP